MKENQEISKQNKNIMCCTCVNIMRDFFSRSRRCNKENVEGELFTWRENFDNKIKEKKRNDFHSIFVNDNIFL